MKEVKCEHCGFWTNGNLSHCNYCAKRLNERQYEEQQHLENNPLRGMPLVKIDPKDPFVVKGFKQVLRFLQLIFATIISIIGAMASSTVH
jgi:hypothetical protein